MTTLGSNTRLIDLPNGVAVINVLWERTRQDAKFGEQNHDLTTWMTVLGEEFGELCKEILTAKEIRADDGPITYHEASPTNNRIREEAVQVAAVALAIIEYVDRHSKLSPQLKVSAR